MLYVPEGNTKVYRKRLFSVMTAPWTAIGIRGNEMPPTDHNCIDHLTQRVGRMHEGFIQRDFEWYFNRICGSLPSPIEKTQTTG